MEGNDKKMTDLGKVEYTFNILLNDIQSEPTEDNKRNETSDKAGREYGSKLIVIQMLIALAELFKTENYKDDEKLSNAIEIKVNGNELLSGYMFFVSQNPQFDYSWNYMRKSRANYKEFLAYSVRFFNNVLVDINMLAGKSLDGRDMHVVFHDILDIRFTSDKPFVKTRLLWENFYRLATVKKEYNIIVKVKEAVLKAGIRKKPLDMENLIDSALEMVNNYESLKNNEQENEAV